MQTRINSMINRPEVETLFPQRFLIVANAGLSIVRTQKKEAGHSPFLRIYPQSDLFLAIKSSHGKRSLGSSLQVGSRWINASLLKGCGTLGPGCKIWLNSWRRIHSRCFLLQKWLTI